MFDTVLVANRGEIAVRIMRTLRAMGIGTVAVYSDADAGARHVREADRAVHIGPTPSLQSYLNIERLIDAATRAGAQAVHPGYGFLAENAAFARACAQAGVVFIGPPPSAIEAMGDKIRAKQMVAAAGVPVVPGRAEPGLDDDALIASALEVGFPVLLKPSAGGGGKGMRVVSDEASLAGEIAAARREARGSFGDDTLLVERYLDRPRHIEIQVLADAHGNTVHFGERECSLQRRHQKVIEEAPSPLLSAPVRAAMGAQAVAAARACGYVNAGTVEFIVSGARPHEFFFIEMNTRLQVEHPVTEMVYGVDLVELQVRVAAGERLPFSQADLAPAGHAIEARVYAEDPARRFLPTGGTVTRLREPAGPGVRVDSSLVTGADVGSTYDPMLAKVIAHGRSRDEARRRLIRALGDTAVLGVGTNTAFLRRVLAHPDVVAGALDTGLLERHLDELVDEPTPPEVWAAAALDWLLRREAVDSADPWDTAGGWRVGGPAWVRWPERNGDGPEAGEPGVWVRGAARAALVRIADGAGAGDVAATGTEVGSVTASAAWETDGTMRVTFAGQTRTYERVFEDSTLWLGRAGRAWSFVANEGMEAARRTHGHGGGGSLSSPMPGTVIAVNVGAGDEVAAGQALVIVEAMKMEHTVVSPFDATVRAVHVVAGQQVALNQALVVVEERD